MVINNSHTLIDRSTHESTVAEIDPNRPPQLNEDNISYHCACDCSRGTAAESNTVPTETPPMIDLDNDDKASITSSEYEELDVTGDEGVEEHLIEVGDLGYVPIRTIQLALARLNRCTCHHGIGVLPDAEDYPFPALPSRAQSPGLTLGGSMIAEASNEEQSLASSMLSYQSRNSSVFALAGGWATNDSFAPAVGVYILNPLRLTPDLGYPLELSISDGDLDQGDVW